MSLWYYIILYDGRLLLYYCTGDTARIRSCRKAVKRVIWYAHAFILHLPLEKSLLKVWRTSVAYIYENRYLYIMSYRPAIIGHVFGRSVGRAGGRRTTSSSRPMILGWERKKREKKRASWKMKWRTGGRSPDRDRSYTFKHLGVHTLPVAKLACCLRWLDISYIIIIIHVLYADIANCGESRDDIESLKYNTFYTKTSRCVDLFYYWTNSAVGKI